MKNITLEQINAKKKPVNTAAAVKTQPETDDSYPLQIREAQGDLADQANIEIDQEIQEAILRARQELAHPTSSDEDVK